MLLPPSFPKGTVRKANGVKDETIELMIYRIKQKAEKHAFCASHTYLQHQLYNA